MSGILRFLPLGHLDISPKGEDILTTVRFGTRLASVTALWELLGGKRTRSKDRVTHDVATSHSSHTELFLIFQEAQSAQQQPGVLSSPASIVVTTPLPAGKGRQPDSSFQSHPLSQPYKERTCCSVSSFSLIPFPVHKTHRFCLPR